MSKTKGFTVADMEEAGLRPDVAYTALPPGKLEEIMANRASRHGTHYSNAQTDKGLNANKTELMSILEQSLLARKYKP
jgi:ribosomal protein L13E